MLLIARERYRQTRIFFMKNLVAIWLYDDLLDGAQNIFMYLVAKFSNVIE